MQIKRDLGCTPPSDLVVHICHSAFSADCDAYSWCVSCGHGDNLVTLKFRRREKITIQYCELGSTKNASRKAQSRLSRKKPLIFHEKMTLWRQNLMPKNLYKTYGFTQLTKALMYIKKMTSLFD
ncbi:hypothetical protein [Geopseudomonas sagittaria]|uniref:hypothetical protein n=1 Tax=Geopseudomonas sagittaria TaxID=1135990 RepID=UPI00111388FE|nr:hypothetical protein [Pseudomonas sagittaria]MCM2318434.1 hypothetical protein [Pseudomonas sp.]